MTAKFVPTKKQRQLVEEAAGYGLRQADIAQFLRIDKVTLTKYFRQELDNGKFKIDMVAGSTILKSMGASVDERVRLDAARFWAARRMGWKENVGLEHTGADGGAIEVKDVSAVDFIRTQLEHARERLEDGKNVEGDYALELDSPGTEHPLKSNFEKESLDIDTGDMKAISTGCKSG